MERVGTRRRFSKEFKVEALELTEKLGSIAEAARSLDISESQIYYWKKQLQNDGGSAFRGSGVMKPDELEHRRLLRELEQLKRENEFLKKASAYFATHSKQNPSS